MTSYIYSHVLNLSDINQVKYKIFLTIRFFFTHMLQSYDSDLDIYLP